MGERRVRLTLFLILLFFSIFLSLSGIRGKEVRKALSFADPLIGNVYSELARMRRGGGELLTTIRAHVKSHLTAAQEKEKLLKRIETLNRETAGLKEELYQYKEAYRENAKLKSLLRITKRLDYNTIGTYPVGTGSSRWTHSLLIDAGTEKGIGEGSPLINEEGIAGVVTEAHRRWSLAVLITDPAFAIHVRDERSGVTGIVRGTGGELCELDYVVADRDVKVGDGLVASGMAGIYPKGYPVGMVKEITREPGEFYMNVRVKPSISLHKLGYLLVVLR